ncbi:hypothetical protein A8950_0810 [Dongia mobilis]|uniref:Cache domain-containing protein n=1 Tax=Dongia mobilis TaxID=578943 RepID=A0A4R6WRM8_9PROT|nr:cache domain-containing protein [Dongia mobilis]TDQ84262.1 hypothetical protein A8950_0810 [Dongia mobilis]
MPERRTTAWSAAACILLALALTGCADDGRRAAQRTEAEAVARLAATFVADLRGDAERLAAEVVTARTAGRPRTDISAIAEAVLRDKPDRLGISVAFEPDGYDGDDAGHESQRPVGDKSGRFGVYYFRSGDGSVVADNLQMTAEAGIDLWYSPVIATGRKRLDEPFRYPLGGVEQPISSILLPLVADGNIIGVATVETLMTPVIDEIAARDQAWPGRIWVISEAGNWIVHADASRNGTTIDSATAQSPEEVVALETYRDLLSSDRTVSDGTAGPFALRVTFEDLQQSWIVITTPIGE